MRLGLLLMNPDYYETSRGERALERLKTIQPADAQMASQARVPAFVDVRKTEYLVLRSVHFTHVDALELAGISVTQYNNWMNNDPDFAAWATGKMLHELMDRIGEKIVRSRFLQNVFLQLSIDQSLLYKRAMHPEEMTETDRKEATEAMKRYSAPNIAAMLRVLEPETHGAEASGTNVTVQVTIEGEVAATYQQRRAAARKLLEDWTEKQAIEGEFEVKN